jgi:hypothetical protein
MTRIIGRMCDLAHVVTCSSEVMAGIIKDVTGRDAVVIPDPYENDQGEPQALAKESVVRAPGQYPELRAVCRP